jgi:hypothetical protein
MYPIFVRKIIDLPISIYFYDLSAKSIMPAKLTYSLGNHVKFNLIAIALIYARHSHNQQRMITLNLFLSFISIQFPIKLHNN